MITRNFEYEYQLDLLRLKLFQTEAIYLEVKFNLKAIKKYLVKAHYSGKSIALFLFVLLSIYLLGELF